MAAGLEADVAGDCGGIARFEDGAVAAQPTHFAGTAEFIGAVFFAGPVGGLGEVAAFPAVKYLRIFSRRFGPIPRMASKSSTLLKGP